MAERDKRFSCKSIPKASSDRGMMFRLQYSNGTLTLKIVDKDGKDIPCGNVLSIDQYGFLVLHGGVHREQDLVILDRGRGEIVNRRDRDSVTLAGDAARNLPAGFEGFAEQRTLRPVFDPSRFGELSEVEEVAVEEDELPIDPELERAAHIFSMPPPEEPTISLADWDVGTYTIRPTESDTAAGTTRTLWNPFLGEMPTLRRRS